MRELWWGSGLLCCGDAPAAAPGQAPSMAAGQPRLHSASRYPSNQHCARHTNGVRRVLAGQPLLIVFDCRAVVTTIQRLVATRMSRHQRRSMGKTCRCWGWLGKLPTRACPATRPTLWLQKVVGQLARCVGRRQDVGRAAERPPAGRTPVTCWSHTGRARQANRHKWPDVETPDPPRVCDRRSRSGTRLQCCSRRGTVGPVAPCETSPHDKAVPRPTPNTPCITRQPRHKASGTAAPRRVV